MGAKSDLRTAKRNLKYMRKRIHKIKGNNYERTRQIRAGG